jgi:hypothetical protein
VPDDRTTVTELATALGTLGLGDLASTLDRRPHQVDIADATWLQLEALHRSGRFDADFATAFANGRAFLEAEDALRGRPPRLVEWTGGRRPPGDEVAPVDLRIDHVYLVSCKYLSRNIANPSPARLFDGLLATSGEWAQTDWYEAVAREELSALYEACRRATGLTDLSDDLGSLSTEERQRLRRALPGKSYPPDARHAYRELCARVSAASAQRWLDNVSRRNAAERMVWRLLRIGNASYFLLGADARRSLRLRVASSWDWRQSYRLVALDIVAGTSGQPQVNWSASYVERATMRQRTVQGHVEVRWSHGRFAQPPEAKVYLDTPTDELPGYFALERGADQPELWE